MRCRTIAAMNPIAWYTHWLHGRWPAGAVEPLPEIREDGRTSVEGLFVVGDLTGVPLLKFAVDGGARAVRTLLADPGFRRQEDPGRLDLVIVGAGVAGMSAAVEAKKAGLRFAVLEASGRFSTLQNFPKKKPIYTYPSDFNPLGSLVVSANVKEALVEELVSQTEGIEVTPAKVTRIRRAGGELVVEHQDGSLTAERVIVAIGRSGQHRQLGVPGEERAKNRLYDPADHAAERVLVVGGGDAAVEAAVLLERAGAEVTLAHRKEALTRPKPENLAALERAGPRLEVKLGTQVDAIEDNAVVLKNQAGELERMKIDTVLSLIGREAPLDFFRRSGVPIRGEWRTSTYLSLALFLSFCIFVYHWKTNGFIARAFEQNQWFPYNVPGWLAGLGPAAADPSTALGTLAITLRQPGFYYSFIYTAAIVGFGIDRMRRRRTPYVTAQTMTLMGFQILPLFLLPYLILPYIGHNGGFDAGFGKTFADNLFPAVGYDHGREYWRAFGFILAWPLFIWNFFTPSPMAWWLAIGAVQTFVLIPLLIYYYGKGAYCGWICSCGALAETMGDRHRHKMPHGPVYNQLNMVGQVLLAVCLLLFGARIVAWTVPDTLIGQTAEAGFRLALNEGGLFGFSMLNYAYLVDLWLAGVLGVGLYFWFSGRVWCRFACPLAALMHIYARFSRFRIFADKKKCISCNVCTSVCHQGIDIMSFANKGAPMADPQCVRCSACVQQCPTGVLSFGRFGSGGLVQLDTVRASPVRAREAGKPSA